MKAKASSLRSVALALCALLLAGLGGSGCRLLPGQAAEESRRRLREQVPQFAQIPERAQLTDQPYIRGRLLVLSKRPSNSYHVLENDQMFWHGDAQSIREVMAESPEQVETVALLSYRYESVGRYRVPDRSGTDRLVNADVEICELILIDRSIPAVIHRRDFRGTDPLPTRSIREDEHQVIQEAPTQEARVFLASLPRR